MSVFHIDLRLEDKSRVRQQDLSGDLHQACVAAFSLADRLSEDPTPAGKAPLWVEIFEDDRLHISISVTPGTPLHAGNHHISLPGT